MGLTKDQEHALECCMSGDNIFITGGGGVGKTYLIKQIVEKMKKSGWSVMLTAPTGRAAQLIGGATCHRAFRIPLKMAWGMNPQPGDCEHLCVTDVVIIDEISMVRMDVFGYIYRCLQSVRAARIKAGKKPVQLIVVGDFLQLPPVIVTPKDGSLGDADLMARHYGHSIGRGYAFQAPEWETCGFVVCDLKEVVRQSDRSEIEMLNRLRYGDTSVLHDIKTATRKKSYPPNEKNVVYLCGKNRSADKINRESLDRLTGPERTYRSVIVGTVTENDKPAPDILHLREGAQIMMLQNTDDYVNGDTGTILSLGGDYVCVTLNNDEQTTVTVSYACWDVTTYVTGPDGRVTLRIIGQYSQLPLRPAYAVTIHRSQGQTLEKAVLCVGKAGSEIFSSGQLYVGASRITYLGNLYIKGSLQGVKYMASREVIDFYSSIGIDILTPAESSPTSPANTETVKPKRRVKKEKKLPIPKEQKSEAGRDDEVAIAVPCDLQKIILSFATVLDPAAHADSTAIYVSPNSAPAVSAFIKNF